MPLRVFLCWIAVLGFAVDAAAQTLQPLRVDPTLLGGSPAPKKDAPVAVPATVPSEPAAAPQSAPPAKPVVLEAPQRIEPAPAPAPAPAPVPVAPAPSAVEKPAPSPMPVRSAPAAVEASPAPAAIPKRVVEPAAPEVAAPSAPVARQAAEPTRVVGVATLPPLRVDPALLGTGMPIRKEPASHLARPSTTAPAATTATTGPQRLAAPAAAAEAQPAEPPLVGERPALPPTYSAYAAAGELPALRLKPTATMTALAPSDEPRPNFLVADRIHGRNDVEMIAEGNAELRKIGTSLASDKLTYWHLDDEVEALGSVRLQREQDAFTGPKLRLQVEENVGFFERPAYSLRRSQVIKETQTFDPFETEEPAPLHRIIDAHGEAERLEFRGEGLYRASKATYSTCSPGRRDWYAEADELDLDYNREVAEGSHGKVVFLGVPILYSPWLSFSLNNNRKSGFLTPSFGTTNTSGGEFSLPWYWNIAPNMDATLTPRIMKKRGTQLNTDIRYLDHLYSGTSRFEYLPSDRAYGKSRFGYSIIHNQQLGYGFTGALNLNSVSDDTYYKDLSSPVSSVGQSYLLRQGQLSYGSTWWSATLLSQRYQVLQDPSLPPVAELYRRTPQLNVAANRFDLPLDGVFNFAGEYVRFGHPTSVIGQRTTMYPQLSLPLQTSWLRVVPKLGVHATRYQLERQGAGVPDNQKRQVPVASLDGSVVFEREFQFFDKDVVQTLEPRLFYLYVPKRDQSNIPVFDTGIADFNFATAFAENRYSGGDRIADANQITAAVTSRIVDPASGAEVVRGMVGQRYYFTTQHVTLPGEAPRAGRSADVLAAFSGRVLPKTYVDTGWQYNPRDRATERFNAAARYQPETGKVLNAGYRYTRTQLGQVDVSGQWPIWGGWHGVGRYNFSTKDRRLIESVAGLEFDAGCWVARVVARRIATQTQKATTSLFVQLELNGFSRLGSNPLDVLKRSVPGYGTVNQQPTSDSTLY